MVVSFPLSAGNMRMDFCNSFSAFLPCAGTFGVGTLNDFEPLQYLLEVCLSVHTVSVMSFALALLQILRPVLCPVSLHNPSLTS